MGLRINSNTEAFQSHRILNKNANALAKSMEKLSSGFRINRASDDAAGLVISERLRGQISGLSTAVRNAQDGISFANTAEGGLAEIGDMLQRVRDLAVQHLNGTNDATTRTAIEQEASALMTEIGRTITGTTYNNVTVLNTAAVNFRIGASGADTVAYAALNTAGATVANTAAITAFFPGTGAGAPVVATIDAAIQAVAAARGTVGATASRLEHSINSMSIQQENLMAADSRLRDVDMASEMTNLSRLQILQQSGMAMLAQANMGGQSVLKLMQ